MGVPTYTDTQMRDSAWQAELACTERRHRSFAMAIGYATTGGPS
jgi:hypothetical protein